MLFRSLEFVTRKVTYGAAAIKLGKMRRLPLGNLDTKRDWGHAADYVKAMWLMLQKNTPRDYVIATGETHSVREMVELAFDCVGLNWRQHVVRDKRFMRPADVTQLVGNAVKARRELGWKAEVSFRELIEMMVKSDLELIRRDRHDAG